MPESDPNCHLLVLGCEKVVKFATLDRGKRIKIRLTKTNVYTYYPVREIPSDLVKSLPLGKACANTEVFAVNTNQRTIKYITKTFSIVKMEEFYYLFYQKSAREQKDL